MEDLSRVRKAEAVNAGRFDQEVGPLVNSVLPQGLAERAGLKPGDVVLSVDQDRTMSAEAFTSVMRARIPGARSVLTVTRNRAIIPINIELGAVPPN